jgi:hypothetical protein
MLTAAEIAAMKAANDRQLARHDGAELQRRGIAGERKFNPAEPRDPHSGKWIGAGGAVEDALKLAGRIQLGDGETLHSSGKLTPRYGEGSLAWAAIDSPRGREIRLGALPGDDVDKWKAANKGATASLSPRSAAHLRDDLADAQTRAKAAAKKADAAWNSGKAPTDPVLLGESPVAQGRIATPWGDVHYEIHITDDDPASYVTSIRIGDASPEDVSMLPKELAKFLAELERLIP